MTEQRNSGYRPLRLTLKGFRGIRSGLGRDEIDLDLDALMGDAQLVAITGANGRGKTTVMDNLHPYLTMPSRAGAGGLGAFSYYDHVFLPQSEKELVWRHDGRTFRTHLVFRVNGKKKTEAYLLECIGGGWQPARLDDGTVSDGKVETYERLVNQILGAQDTFFASVFSAQGKRPLSAFANGEIKVLLGDLLGLEYVREQGAKAGEVVKGLRAGLALLRRDAVEAQERVRKADGAIALLGDVAAKADAARAAKADAGAVLEQAQQAVAHATAAQQASAADDARRKALVEDRAQVTLDQASALKRLKEEGDRLDGREAALRHRVQARVGHHAARRRALADQETKLRATLRLADEVGRAVRRCTLAGEVASRWADRKSEAQRLVDAADRLLALRNQARHDIAATEREAGQLALRHADLERRFGLARAVPCAGSDLAGRCQLLGDAREAQGLMPSAAAQLQQLAVTKDAHRQLLATADKDLAAMGEVAARRNLAEARFERAQARAQAMLLLAARAGEVEQARAALAAVQAELQDMPAEPQAFSADEAAEQADIVAARQRIAAEGDRLATVQREAIARIDSQLAQLPAPFDLKRLDAVRQAMALAQQGQAAADTAERGALRESEEHKAALAARDAAAEQQLDAERRARRVEDELTAWSLLAKCLSNDGIVALDIDDAGPTFSALANDLLLACYGPRFTLEVITQTQNAKGELREDFDILVHDGWRDETKSLKLVSGGERVWINECLTRAIALYLADNTNRRLSTLFCDEADGPLDPERKRMFMAMKREVLRVGGYEAEFFVSQTPELTAMADRVIDLDAMAVAGASAG